MKVYYIVPREGVHRTLTALGGNTSSGDLGANVVCEGLRLVSTVELGSGLGLALLEDSLGVSAKVTSISVGVKANTVTTADRLDVLLVHGERLDVLLIRDVVGENALADRLGKDESLETVTGLLDGLVTLKDELVGQQGVINRETDLAGKAEELVTVLVADVATHVSKGDRPGHVDADGVTVTERYDLRIK